MLSCTGRSPDTYLFGTLNRLNFYYRRLRSAYARAETERQLGIRFPDARLDQGVHVVSPDRLELGSDVLVQRNTVLHCGGLPWSGGRGGITLRSNVTIGSDCILWGAGTITLEEGAELGPACLVFSSAQDYANRLPEPVDPPLVFKPVRIERYVSVYSGAIISPGVTLGEGAVIAAGSVVVGDVPRREFWAGVPARRVKTLPEWPAPRP